MAAKKILLLLGSDRLAYPLIRYLAAEGKKSRWKTKVGCMFEPGMIERLKKENFPGEITFISITKIKECDGAIRKSDIVIGLMADSLLLQVADKCISQGKTLISPARLNRQMALKKTLVKEKEVFILMDCGFSPGLDHIIAKKAIDNIHLKTGKITSFQTYNGSFIAEGSVDNPWKFKLTEPSSEVMNWGRHNNRHLNKKRLQHIPFHRLFERSKPIEIRGLEDVVAVPEGDSLYYRKIYGLADAHTVVKGKLMKKDFDRMWRLLIRLGLADPAARIDFGTDGSFRNLLESLLPLSETETIEQRLQEYSGASAADIEKLRWLGWFETSWVDGIRETTPSVILQHLMEKKFALAPDDKDILVMEHQLGYEFRDEFYEFKATLLLQGENRKDSALAKVTGFTCGAAAKSVLSGSISLKGLHIPTIKEIYDPILNELEELGISFHVEEKKILPAESSD